MVYEKYKTKEEYAEYLQKTFERYFEDFAKKNGISSQQLIVKYCGENSDIEDMYSIDTILNFLADYGNYYLQRLEEITDYDQVEELNKKIEEIDKEYSILERLIYNTGKAFMLQKEEGEIKEITEKERQKAFTSSVRVCSRDEIKEISKWLRYSYYIFVNNYRNQKTSLQAGKKQYSFLMTEDNICHLLGIKREMLLEELSTFLTNKEKISTFEFLEMFTKNDETVLERIFEFQKETPLFNYDMIKYKNFLFQNFGMLSNCLAIWTNAKPEKNNRWLSDTFFVKNTRCGNYTYSRLGFFLDNSENSMYVPETLQADKKLTNGTGSIYNIKAIFKTAIGKVKKITESREDISTKNLCCIFSAEEQLEMIKKILDEEKGVLTEHNVTELKIYFHNICRAMIEFLKTKNSLKTKCLENNLQNSNTKKK